mmetsp:Transcript_73575/g.208363  ORF Transcript_73575/g.208363 Transcript_73575/m.208363 type:complete len:253 (+) Transcript_73575:691-1449(+)
MASHMIWLRMAPEEPIRAPTMVSRVLSRTKPSAVSAQPDALLRSVMATGMSAPPTCEVTSRPSSPAEAAPASSISTPGMGPSCAASPPRKRASATAEAAEPPGSFGGAPGTSPCSFAKATAEPVTVSAPMPAARYSETTCMLSVAPASAPRAEATAASAAAAPTREWNAATSCGRAVISTCDATAPPAAAPAASVPPICISTGAGAPEATTSPTVPARPPATPATPMALPNCAVLCELSPPMAATHMTEAIR